jgi:membrane protein required for beta-lactamase induction
MVLIAILFCLALQRFANIGGWFNSAWFEIYLKNLKPWAVKLNEWVAILLVIAPVLLFLALLHWVLSKHLFGLFNLILATLVLFLCIDARDLKNRLAPYFANLEKEDTHAAASAAANVVGDVSSNNMAELNRSVTKAILLNSFDNLFAGLFWFMLFGPYGVTTYLLIALLSKNANKIDSAYAGIAKLATQIQDVLDWVPSRLTGISYALVGNFNKGLGYFNKHLWSGLTDVRKFSVDAGLAALDIDSSATKATSKENYAALDLVNRILTIWLMALALVLLGTWL